MDVYIPRPVKPVLPAAQAGAPRRPPPPFSLTRAHRRTVRGPHIVMRALLEKGRAKLGKDALFVIYNLYRRMPDPMFRVILSFL